MVSRPDCQRSFRFGRFSPFAGAPLNLAFAILHRVQRALTIAAVTVLLGGSYVALNVFGNYGGNVSGLFYTGRNVPLPRDIARHTWRVKDTKGYDAQ